MKKVLLLSAISLCLFGLCGCRKDKKTLVGEITNGNNFRLYLDYTSTYVEQGSEGEYYLLYTVRIYSLKEEYYFEDTKVSFTGDAKSLYFYSIPSSGNVELSIMTKKYQTKEAMSMQKLLGCKVANATGKVYTKNN